LNLLDVFPKKAQISYFTKTRPVGAELFLADGREYRDNEINSRFLQFNNTLNNKDT